MPNRDYYVDDDIRSKTEPAYRKYMTDLMTMLAGNTPNITRINIVVDEVSYSFYLNFVFTQLMYLYENIISI